RRTRVKLALIPKISGMNLVIELSHPKYKSAIYSKLGLVDKSAATSNSKQIEILIIDGRKLYIVQLPHHSTILRYLENDQNRKNMENRAKAKGLFLIYDPNFRGLSIAADGKKAIT
ncbi:Endo/exonuclease/phosphatase domain-containing protein, partial [Aphis craccivora]